MQEAPGALGNDESYRKKEYGHARAARERAGWDCVFIGRRRVQCVCCDGAGTHRGHAREWAGREGVNRIFLYELRHTRIPKYSTHNNRKAHATVCRGAIARISSGRTPPLSTLHAHAITTHTTLVVHCCLSHTPLSPPAFSPILVCPPLSINILSSKAHSRTSTHLTLSVSITSLKRAHEGGPTPAAGLRP